MTPDPQMTSVTAGCASPDSNAPNDVTKLKYPADVTVTASPSSVSWPAVTADANAVLLQLSSSALMRSLACRPTENTVETEAWPT